MKCNEKKENGITEKSNWIALLLNPILRIGLFEREGLYCIFHSTQKKERENLNSCSFNLTMNNRDCPQQKDEPASSLRDTQYKTAIDISHSNLFFTMSLICLLYGIFYVLKIQIFFFYLQYWLWLQMVLLSYFGAQSKRIESA